MKTRKLIKALRSIGEDLRLKRQENDPLVSKNMLTCPVCLFREESHLFPDLKVGQENSRLTNKLKKSGYSLQSCPHCGHVVIDFERSLINE